MTEEQEHQSPAGEMSVGSQLRAAREAAGLSRADIAARTRITERHIAAIEADDFGALAGRTYAVGFSRSYAKVVGLDPDEVAEAVRELTGHASASSDPGLLDDLEPGDPSRVPTRATAWLAGLGAFVVVIVGFFAWRTFLVPEMSLPSLVRDEPQVQAAAPAAKSNAGVPIANGPVVFTATEDGIWVKFYDANGVQLMQKQMARGETYAVPAEADGPLLWTGRPEALTITVGGKAVPPLADRQMTVKDMPVSAEALLSRAAPEPMPAAVSTPSPAAVVSTPRPAQVRTAAPQRRRESASESAMPPPPSPEIDAPAKQEEAPAADSTVSD